MLEDLALIKEAFYEKEVKQKNRIQILRQELSDANRDINDTNAALDKLRKVLTIQYSGRSFDIESRLNDFYKPSEEMKEYQLVFTAAVGIPLVYLIYTMV